MNERIKELATEVGISVEYLTNTKQIVLIEKFAELIALDCARVCDEIAEMAEITNTGEVARKTKATAVSCSNFIKNRFGVKS